MRILFEDVSAKSRHVTCGRERVVLVATDSDKETTTPLEGDTVNRLSTVFNQLWFPSLHHTLIVIHDTLPRQL